MPVNLQELLVTFPKVEVNNHAPLVKNVFVSRERAIFNTDWTFNSEGSHHFLYWDSNFRSKMHAEKGLSFKDRCQNVSEEAKKRKIEQLPDTHPYVLCSHYYLGYPFGNWFETLASIRFVKDKNFKILAHQPGGFPGTGEIELHFELAGFDLKDIQFYEPRKVTPFVNRLYCPNVDRIIGEVNNKALDLPPEAKQWRDQRFDWLREKYLSHPKVKSVLDYKPRKLYLSRNFFTHPNPDWTRRVLNEETEVVPFLEKRGFTVVKGSESLLETINLFHSATTIVFPHGSAIHNAIFCQGKPKIIEFMSEFRLRNHFYKLFADRSIYKMVVSKADRSETNNITIDLNILKRELEA